MKPAATISEAGLCQEEPAIWRDSLGYWVLTLRYAGSCTEIPCGWAEMMQQVPTIACITAAEDATSIQIRYLEILMVFETESRGEVECSFFSLFVLPFVL